MGLFGLDERQLTIRSPHNPTVCRDRIRAVTDKRLSIFGSGDIVASATSDSIQLLRRKPAGSAWAMTVEALVTLAGSGSTLECRAGLSARNKIGLGCLAAGGVAIFAAGATAWLTGGTNPNEAPVFVFLPLIFPLMGWGLTRAYAFAGRGERDFLVDFLVRTVDGTILEDSAP